MTTTNRAAVAAHHPASQGLLVHMVESFSTRLRQARAAAETRRALKRLSDRELDDIGLSRGQIDAMAERISQAGRA